MTLYSGDLAFYPAFLFYHQSYPVPLENPVMVPREITGKLEGFTLFVSSFAGTHTVRSHFEEQ